MRANPPQAQAYTMGDRPLEVTFDEFRIGYCRITGYSASYKTRSGESLAPYSFNLDSSSRKLTVSGAKGDFDVIPCGADFIDIVVEVTGSASPTLNTTMQFVVTLKAEKSQNNYNPSCNNYAQKIAKSLESKPYFFALG